MAKSLDVFGSLGKGLVALMVEKWLHHTKKKKIIRAGSRFHFTPELLNLIGQEVYSMFGSVVMTK